MNWGETKVFT
jgi:hypothetical protein